MTATTKNTCAVMLSLAVASVSALAVRLGDSNRNTELATPADVAASNAVVLAQAQLTIAASNAVAVAQAVAQAQAAAGATGAVVIAQARADIAASNAVAVATATNLAAQAAAGLYQPIGAYLTAEADPYALPRLALLEGRSNVWNTAYSWGDHSLVGYLTTEADPIWAGVSNSVTGNALQGATAYGWGDHSTFGYLTAPSIAGLVSKTYVDTLMATGTAYAVSGPRATVETLALVAVAVDSNTVVLAGAGLEGVDGEYVLSYEDDWSAYYTHVDGGFEIQAYKGEPPLYATLVDTSEYVPRYESSDFPGEWYEYWDGGVAPAPSGSYASAPVTSLVARADALRWDEAHGWGDHAAAGYLSGESDPVWAAQKSGYLTALQSTQLVDSALAPMLPEVGTGYSVVWTNTAVDVRGNSVTNYWSDDFDLATPGANPGGTLNLNYFGWISHFVFAATNRVFQGIGASTNFSISSSGSDTRVCYFGRGPLTGEDLGVLSFDRLLGKVAIESVVSNKYYVLLSDTDTLTAENYGQYVVGEEVLGEAHTGAWGRVSYDLSQYDTQGKYLFVGGFKQYPTWRMYFDNIQLTRAPSRLSFTNGEARVHGSLSIDSEDALYFGARTANGCWRITPSGDNLVFQRREADAWVTKDTITP